MAKKLPPKRVGKKVFEQAYWIHDGRHDPDREGLGIPRFDPVMIVSELPDEGHGTPAFKIQVPGYGGSIKVYGTALASNLDDARRKHQHACLAQLRLLVEAMAR